MLNVNEINPYIRVAMHSVLNTGITIKPRIIFDYELIYIEKGEMTFYYNGEPHKVGGGQFIFIRPGITHSFENIRELYQPHFHFDFIYNTNSEKTPVSFLDEQQLSSSEKQLVSRDYFLNYRLSPFVTFSDVAAALKLFYNGINAHSTKKPLLAKGYLTSLLSLLINDNFNNTLSSDVASYSIARQIYDLINSGQGLNFSLYDFEKHFSYSKFYLERLFKNEYGISIIAYQNDKRLEKAADLIKDMTVNAVANELGYSSIYSFSRAFKNKYGFSPSKLR